MDRKTLPQKLPSGGSSIKTMEEFTALCSNEHRIRYESMLDEFKGRKANLDKIRDAKIEEYRFINAIIAFNTSQIAGKIDVSVQTNIDKQLADLNFETVAGSFPLDYWRMEYGQGMIVQVICDLMNYFLQQFQVKETLSDTQIMQLAVKLLACQPKLKVKELVFVLNNALNGHYGPTYQRIGIDSILLWINKFYEEGAAYIEQARINTKPEESRGDVPWEVEERRLKEYEAKLREKKLVAEKVYGFAKRQREIEEYKNGHKDEIKNATTETYSERITRENKQL